MTNATTIKNVVLAITAAVGSSVANALGGWDMALQVLIAFMAIDYLTGFLVAAVWHHSRKTPDGTLDSRAGAKGLARKMMILLFVGLGAGLDRLTGSDFLRDCVCIFYIGNEGLSILENTSIMGVPYPQRIKDALEILRERGDHGKEEPDDPDTE